ncbi:MAG: c-type cytochrome [Longimicrobiales bacterium]
MKKWLRRAAIGAGSIVTFVLLLAIGVYGFSSRGMSKKYEVQDAALSIPTDSASVAWGQRMATAIGKCVECHGADLAGKTMMENGAMGLLASSNLTRGKGGIGATYTDADFVRALRHGVRPDGSTLVFMPSQEYTYFNDEDLAALIAYLRTIPPVDKDKPQTQLGPVARVLYLTKAMPLIPAEWIDHESMARPVIARGPTAEYGKYLARVGGCKGCHSENLAGGSAGEPGTPPAANLTPAGIGKWTYDDFVRALRQGTRPDGRTLSPAMPFVYTAQMTDDEIRAVWEYLKTVPSVETVAK